MGKTEFQNVRIEDGRNAIIFFNKREAFNLYVQGLLLEGVAFVCDSDEMSVEIHEQSVLIDE